MLTTHVSAQTKVLAFAGSARADSVNKKLIREAITIAKEMGAEVKLIDLKDYPLPIYDADFEQDVGMPDNVKEIRQLMIQSQVILIASPDYNNSIPALLKNTIDWTSRSEEKGPSREAFQGKTFVIMSASPGKGGGAGALVHLRDIIADIKGDVLKEQVSIPDAYNAFDENGKLKSEKQNADLRKLIDKALH